MSRRGGDVLEKMRAAADADGLRQSLRATQRQLATAKAKTADLVAAVYAGAKAAAEVYPPAPPIKTPAKGRPGDHAALLHSTDWQIGKRTASYNSDAAAQAVARSVERALRLTDLQRHAYAVSSCALLLGGDMVEGTSIFPAQPWQVDSTLFDQMFRVSGLLDQMVRSLLAEFDHVEVWEEYGNHGRIGRLGEGPAEDNVDRMAYRIARDRIGAHKRLTWHPSVNWYNHGTLGAYSFLLVHGDENRRIGAGSPSALLNQVKAYAAGVVEPFVDAYMGHWHRHEQLTLPAGGSLYITGSPETGSEYARQHLGSAGLPSQRLHFIDLHRGRVASVHQLWLD